MDGWLRQSTAVTVPIGPFIDSTDGNTEETGLTIAQADVLLSKNGAASAQKNNATSASHDADGMYLCPFSTTDTNTLGQLVAWVHVAGALFAKHVFQVVPANVWDSMFGTDLLQVDAREFAGVTAVSGAIPAVAAGANGGLPTGDASGRVLLQPTQTGVTIPTVTTLTNAPADSSGITSLLSRLPAGLFTGLSNFAHWLGALAGSQAANATAQTEIRASGAGSGTYDPATDSQQAIRDRGDAAWVTATGFSTLDAAGVRAAVGLGAANLDTQLADIPTVAEMNARTLVAADYATATGLADVPTVAEFEARTLVAASYALDSTVAKEATLADVPTNAELAARTLLAASYATAANQATMDGKLDTIDNLLDTEIAAIISALALINADTDDIQSRLPAALVGGRMDSNASAIGGVSAAAVRLALSAGQIIPGTVDHAGTPSTTTQMDADDITTAAADHYNGRVIIFTSGTLIGQATSISDYALVAGRGRFTFPALTAAPADNVTFIIV